MLPMFFDIKTFLLSLYDLCIQYKERVEVLLALGFVFYVIRWCKLRNVPIKTSSNELGELFVSRDAVLHLIKGISLSVKLCRVTRIRLINKRQILHIKLHVRLQADQSFDVISMEFQQRIQQEVSKCLGIIKNVRVDVILDGIEKKVQVEEPISKDNNGK